MDPNPFSELTDTLSPALLCKRKLSRTPWVVLTPHLKRSPARPRGSERTETAGIGELILEALGPVGSVCGSSKLGSRGGPNSELTDVADSIETDLGRSLSRLKTISSDTGGPASEG